MKMKKETKQMLLGSLGTIVLVAVAIQANKYIVDPAVAKVKGMISKPVTTTTTPETK